MENKIKNEKLLTYKEATELARLNRGQVASFDMGDGKVGYVIWKNGRAVYGEFNQKI